MSRESERDAAREAAIRSLVSNGVYLLMMIGFTVAISKRDELVRLWMRARRIARREEPAEVRSRLAAFRREVSEIEHADG